MHARILVVEPVLDLVTPIFGKAHPKVAKWGLSDPTRPVVVRDGDANGCDSVASRWNTSSYGSLTIPKLRVESSNLFARSIEGRGERAGTAGGFSSRVPALSGVVGPISSACVRFVLGSSRTAPTCARSVLAASGTSPTTFAVGSLRTGASGTGNSKTSSAERRVLRHEVAVRPRGGVHVRVPQDSVHAVRLDSSPQQDRGARVATEGRGSAPRPLSTVLPIADGPRKPRTYRGRQIDAQRCRDCSI
jgi:hypothetical protein